MASIRILEIPKSDGGFRFGGGQTQPFVEVDWFQDEGHPDFPDGGMMETEEGRHLISGEVQNKRYFDINKAYLVLCPTFSFTINYNG